MTRAEMIDDIYATGDGYQGTADLAFKVLELLPDATLEYVWNDMRDTDEDEAERAQCPHKA